MAASGIFKCALSLVPFGQQGERKRAAAASAHSRTKPPLHYRRRETSTFACGACVGLPCFSYHTDHTYIPTIYRHKPGTGQRATTPAPCPGARASGSHVVFVPPPHVIVLPLFSIIKVER